MWNSFDIFDRARIRTSISMIFSFLMSFLSTVVRVILISSTKELLNQRDWIWLSSKSIMNEWRTTLQHVDSKERWRASLEVSTYSRYLNIFRYIDSSIVSLLITDWNRKSTRTVFMKSLCPTISSANVRGVSYIECAWISRRGRLPRVSKTRMRAVELFSWWKRCNWMCVINRSVTWISDRSDICAKDLWWYCALQ